MPAERRGKRSGGSLPPAFFSAAIAIACATSPAAQTIGDRVTGQQIARERCAACHIVEPRQNDVSVTGLPPFASMASDPRITALSLRVFLQTPHVNMPDIVLKNEEMDDLIAYILSLDPDSGK